MAYETIGEQIKVLAVFKNGTIFPHVFEWRGKRYQINKVNLAYQEREGSAINYWFAVESGGLVGKLKYNNFSLIWRFEELWME